MQKIKYQRIAIVFAVIVLIVFGTLTADATKKSDKNILLRSRIERVREMPGIDVRWNRSDSVPFLVSGTNLMVSAGIGTSASKGLVAATDQASVAVNVMAALGDLYGITDAGKELRSVKTETDNTGYSHVRLSQYYKDIKVVGGGTVVHFDAQGKCRAVNGRFISDIDLQVIPKISVNTAGDIARKDAVSGGITANHISGESELVVWARKVKPVLAYSVSVISDISGIFDEWRYIIDAESGKIIIKYNNLQNDDISAPGNNGVHESISGAILTGEGGEVRTITGWHDNDTSSWYFWNKTNTWHIQNDAASGWPDADTYCYRTSNNWGTSDRAGMSLAVNFERILRYYRTVHGRNSYDDNGVDAIANIHVGDNYVNAFWSPFEQQFFFGDGDGIDANELTVLDVSAHEFHHAVTEYTANLIYQGESGALNEAMSDIFGALEEFHYQPDGRNAYPNALAGKSDWLMGEDTWLDGVALRDMRDPRRFKQPSKYMGQYWADTSPGEWDNGGVHINSGIQNFFFYLLCEGGVGNNDGIDYDLTGVGIPVAEKLVYLTETAYFTADTDYAAAANAWIAAAQQLDGNGTTTNATVAVMAAWTAVGVGDFKPVTPLSDYLASGDPIVGPYMPSNRTYTIMNFSATPETWNITANEAWLSVAPGSVTIPALGQTNIIISINQSVAATLAEGAYSDDITFVNTSTGMGNTTRHVVLRIGNNYKVFSATYNWIDPVSNSHTAVSISGGRSTAKTIPFNFNYYSTNYSKVYIADSGIAGFVDSGLNPDDNGTIPLPELPNNILAPMWDDLQGGVIYVGTEGVTPNRKFVMSWIDVAHASDPAVKFSFQSIINEAPNLIDINDIIFQYKDVSQDEENYGGGRSATIGVEDIDGLLGCTYSMNGTTLLADKQALLFTMNNIADTTPPSGKVTVLSHTASSVKFDIRFSEIVTGLDVGDLILSGNASGVTIDSVTGSGERYVATVSFGSGLGSIGLGVQAGAVVDLAGLGNVTVDPGLYIIPLFDAVYSDTMTSGSNGWSISSGSIGIYYLGGWEWGEPSNLHGPVDGNNCWGTVLDGTYSNNMNSWLESPVIHVTDNPVISFDLWYDIENGFDFGFIEVNAGLGWVNVLPATNYTGSSSGWTREQLELDPTTFGNKDLQVRFRFTSDDSATYDGMYVRNFSINSQYDAGIWMQSITPSNMAVSSSADLTVVAYNMTTTTYHNVHGILGSAAGVSINGSGDISYGTIVPGQLVVGTPVVPVTAGAADQFVTAFVDLSHVVSTAEGDWFNNVKRLGITGVSTPPTNVITAKSVAGVVDWLNRPLNGNGDENSSLIQLIYAGADGTNNPAGADGSTTGDDSILYEKVSLLSHGRFGFGGVTADSGKFIVDFLHRLNAGDKVYARAWTGSEYVTATAYGDSELRIVDGGVVQTIDFGAWQVGIPTNCKHDQNGDTVPDGWYVLFGGDPAAAIEPLSSDWTAEAFAGSYGAGSGEMSYPEAIASWSGFVFVADTRNDRIQVWNSDLSSNLWEIGSFGTGTNELNWPAGLAINKTKKQLIVSDMGNNRVVVYDINTINGALTSAFTFGSTGAGDDQFNKPRGVALDSAGNIYIADQANYRIQIFSSTGIYLRKISGISAQPVSVALDSAGKIYALLSAVSIVNVYENSGLFSVSFGSNGSGNGEFNQPADIKIGTGDRIYVVDKSNHRIEILSASYDYLAQYGVQGVNDGELRFPQGMCLDSAGGLYVADTWNHRVQSLSFILDADGDGMDDLWEDANGLDSSDPDDWNADPDGDGLSNIGEYRVGTDPHNRDTNGNGIWDGAEVGMCLDPLGPFDGVVIDNVWHGGKHSLSWNVDAGTTYDVEMATDLINANWILKDTLTAGYDGILGWTNSVMELGRLHYYRVIKNSE